MPAGQNGVTVQNSVINYDDIQKRMDYLSDLNWFNPNAFYPTALVFSTDDTHQNSVRNFFNELQFDQKGSLDPRDPKQEEQIISSGRPSSVTSGKSVLDMVWGSSGKNPPGQSVLCEYNIKTGNDVLGSCAQLNEKALAQIVGIEGLGFPKLPFKKVNGMLVNEKRVEGESNEVKIKILATDYLEVLSFVERWQSEWWAYNGQKKVLRSKMGSDGKPIFFGEGYFGMDYVHVFPNGEIDRIGHLFMNGMVPIHVDLEGLNSLGPMVSGKTEIPMLVVTCLYSQAILGVGASGDKADKRARWYYFK